MSPPRARWNGTIFLCLLAIACWVPLCLQGGEKAGAKKDPLKFLVTPYLQLPTTDGITIMWETDQPASGKVEYGLTRELGSVAEAPKASKLHEVRLGALKRGTKYFYRVASDGLRSDVF